MGLNGAMRSMTIRGRNFKVAHDAPGNKNHGGRNNEVLMNGDGTYRTIQTVVPGQFNDIGLEIEDDRGDQEYLQELADVGLPVPIVCTYANNISYAGDLTLTGEIQNDKSTGLLTASWQGGKLQKV